MVCENGCYEVQLSSCLDSIIVKGLQAGIPYYWILINKFGRAYQRQVVADGDGNITLDLSILPAGSFTAYTTHKLELRDGTNYLRKLQFSFGGSAYSCVEITYQDIYGDDDLVNTIDFAETVEPDTDSQYLQDVIEGDNISIDKTNPKKPVISATGGGGGDVTKSYVDAADAVSQTNIDSEATTRAAADDLKLNISDYTPGVSQAYVDNADSELQDNINAEAAARTAADNLKLNISDYVPGPSTTDDLPQGATNLYFSDALAQAAVDISGKVDKVIGKGLSTEDYTTAEKTKLSGIAAGAQVNVATNLALGTPTSTVIPITNSNGTGFNIPVASTGTPGLMSAADKNQLTTNTSAIAEKAFDNAVVHLAGTETISGAKSFSGNMGVTRINVLSSGTPILWPVTATRLVIGGSAATTLLNFVMTSSGTFGTYRSGGNYDLSVDPSGNVVIGSAITGGLDITTDKASAILQVNSTTQGILPPRMTKTQRNAISSPEAGLLVIVTGETGGEYLSVYNSITPGWEKVNTIAD